MNPSNGTLYAVLGVARTASSEEITRAYLHAIAQFGPERIQAAEGAAKSELEEHLKELNRAYYTVADPASRRRYDEQLLCALNVPPAVAPSPVVLPSAPSRVASKTSAPFRTTRSVDTPPDPRVMAWLWPSVAALIAVVLVAAIGTTFRTAGPLVPATATVPPSAPAPAPPAPTDLPSMLRRNPRDVDLWKGIQSQWRSGSTVEMANAAGIDVILRLLAGERDGISVTPMVRALKAVGQLPPQFYMDLAEAAIAGGSRESAQQLLQFALTVWPGNDQITRRTDELASSVVPPADTAAEGIPVERPEASPPVTPTIITVASSIPDVSISVDGRPGGPTTQVEPGSHTVTISKAGFQTVTRTVDVVRGQNISVPVTLSRLPAPATPNPESDALMVELRAFESSLREGRQGPAVERIARAIGNGLLVLVPIRHDHRNLRIHYLSNGTLTFSRSQLVFVSQNGEDSFSARWSDIEDVKINRVHGDKAPQVMALELKVVLRDVAGKKRRTRTFNLFPPGASVFDGDVRCTDCVSKVPAYVELVDTLKHTPSTAAFDRGPLDGSYFGPVSEGLGNVTITLTQREGSVSGTMLVSYAQDRFRGVLSGVVSGGSLTFTATVKSESGCEMALRGSAGDVTRVAIAGVMSGSRTCGESIRDGRFVLVKGPWPDR